jgi:hypothetical protein
VEGNNWVIRRSAIWRRGEDALDLPSSTLCNFSFLKILFMLSSCPSHLLQKEKKNFHLKRMELKFCL